jgi:hypothetical protein
MAHRAMTKSFIFTYLQHLGSTDKHKFFLGFFFKQIIGSRVEILITYDDYLQTDHLNPPN